jgi:AraC-like DNA-binding protein
LVSDIDFEEALDRIGMRAESGSLTKTRWSSADGDPSGSLAWIGKDMGIFVVDCADAISVDLQASAKQDVLVCSTVLNADDACTDFALGDRRRLDVAGVDMTSVFVPQGQRFRFATRVPQGLKAVTLVIDLHAMIDLRGISAAALPASLSRTIRQRDVAMQTLLPKRFGAIARDVAARRGLDPSLATLYYEGKALDMACALLREMSRCDDPCHAVDALDHGILQRLELVRKSILRAPHRGLDVEDLSRVAGMNRTKLRAAFRQVYGVTLSDYRTALLLERADRALKEAGISIKQAACHAGYSTTSSFIVAYKRHYGMSPGHVLRD